MVLRLFSKVLMINDNYYQILIFTYTRWRHQILDHSHRHAVSTTVPKQQYTAALVVESCMVMAVITYQGRIMH